MNACLLDTGPLVARLDHDLDLRGARLLTTGAVVTEGFYFLSDVQNGPTSLAFFLDVSAMEVSDVFGSAVIAAAARLMSKYSDIPMDFLDATLVLTAEWSGTDIILTLIGESFRRFALEGTVGPNCYSICKPLTMTSPPSIIGSIQG
jgi:uncharacterized protein